MHKCETCIFCGEHQAMGFAPEGVCLREHNLVNAVLAYRAKVCPFKNATDNNVGHKDGGAADGSDA